MATPPEKAPPPPPATQAMPGPQKAPTFDVVRVEPSGDTVIAGQAEPNATVEILDGQTTIATTTADSQGAWALTLDKPLAPGPHDLAIRTTSPDKATQSLSDQRVAVSVPKPGSKDVLVVVNTPEGPSKVLEVPATGGQVASNAPESGGAPPATGTGSEAPANPPQAAAAPPAKGTGTEVAANPPEATGAPPAKGTGAEVAANPPETTGAPPAKGTGTEVAMNPPEAGGAPTVSGTGTEAGSMPPPGETTAGETGGKAAPPATEAPAPETQTAETPPSTSTEPPPAAETPAPGTQTAETPPATSTQPPPADKTEAPVPETQVAQTPPAAETPAPQTTAPQTTAPSPDTSVAAGKEPPVAGEPPIATEPPIKAEPPITTEPPAKVAPPVKVVEAPPPKEKAPPPPPPPPPPQPEVIVSAVEADSDGSVFIAGTTKTGEVVRAYIDGKPVGEATPSPSGTFLVRTQRDMPAGTYNVRVDQLDSQGQVIARAEVPFEKEVEVAILKPTGSASASDGSGASVSGSMPEMQTVIIKRHDTLWHIARKTFGHGIRWTTIYQANTDQIRNPHWIYPGQVFVLPKGNTQWTD